MIDDTFRYYANGDNNTLTYYVYGNNRLGFKIHGDQFIIVIKNNMLGTSQLKTTEKQIMYEIAKLAKNIIRF